MSTLSQSSKQEQSKMQEGANPEAGATALATSPEDSRELPKGVAEQKDVTLSPSSHVEEIHGVRKEHSSSEIPTPRESEDLHSNVPVEDVKEVIEEKKESSKSDPKVQPEGTGTEVEAGLSYVYSNEGFEPEQGSSSAPDVMPGASEQPQGTGDEVQRACQDITEITNRIDSETEIFVKILRNLSKSNAIEKAMAPHPALLSAIYTKMSDLLKEVKESTSAVRNSSASFRKYRNHLVFCSKSLEGLCTDLRKYFEEVNEKLSASESEDEELTGLRSDLNTALLALNNIKETFPAKIRALEAIVVESGDATTGQGMLHQQHPDDISERSRLIVVGIILAVIFILIVVLVGFVVYINLDTNIYNLTLNEAD